MKATVYSRDVSFDEEVLPSITAAVAVKRIMGCEKFPGTVRVRPGIAEESLGGNPDILIALDDRFR